MRTCAEGFRRVTRWHVMHLPAVFSPKENRCRQVFVGIQPVWLKKQPESRLFSPKTVYP